MAKLEHMARWYREDGTIEQHGTCHHASYRLACEDFDAMLDRCGSACELCGRQDVKLQIDHDHNSGTIRGLLCPRCNTAFKYVDAGTRELTAQMEVYLRMADLWEAAKTKAEERGETVTDVLIRALERYVRKP